MLKVNNHILSAYSDFGYGELTIQKFPLLGEAATGRKKKAKQYLLGKKFVTTIQEHSACDLSRVVLNIQESVPVQESIAVYIPSFPYCCSQILQWVLVPQGLT